MDFDAMVKQIAHRFDESSMELVVGTSKVIAYSGRAGAEINRSSKSTENALFCQIAVHVVRREGILESVADIKPSAVEAQIYSHSWGAAPVVHLTEIDKIHSLSIDGADIEETEALLASLYLILAALGFGEIMLQFVIDGLVEDLDAICLSRSG
jgi:hypothetical protein